MSDVPEVPSIARVSASNSLSASLEAKPINTFADKLLSLLDLSIKVKASNLLEIYGTEFYYCRFIGV